MSHEFFKKISDRFKTYKELKMSNNLIMSSDYVIMTGYESEQDRFGKNFGPRGYKEDEMDAVNREIKKVHRVKVLGVREDSTVVDTIWVRNRNKD